MPRSDVRRAPIWTLLVVVALAACDLFTVSRPSVAIGGECTFNDECSAPLVCAARRCRAPCRTDRDCTNNWRCLSAGVVDKFVCYAPEDLDTACVWPSHCLRGRVCTPERICRAQCRADYDCRIIRRDLTCNVDAGVCLGHPLLQPDGTLRDTLRNDDGPNVDPMVGTSGPVDSGTPTDVGPVVDLGTPGDVGSPPDAGTPEDAGDPRACATLTAADACRPGIDVGCTVLSLSAHGGNACALVSGGSMRCWGSNLSGQLGTGNMRSCLWPGLVPSLTTGVSGMAVGQGFACALRPGMGLSCWGTNSRGQLATGKLTPDRNVPTRTVAMEGQPYAGSAHACIVNASSAQCWGDNSYRQLGALFGTRTEYFSPVGVSIGGALSVALGRSHSCAVFSGGTVGCWGSNANGQAAQVMSMTMVNMPAAVMGVDSIEQVVAGDNFTCARRTGGQVFCWGENMAGQLGRGTVASPASDPVPQMVPTITDATELTAGPAGVCAVRADQTVWCWGEAIHLGDGSTAARAVPAQVPGLTAVLGVAGSGPICVRRAGADVRCWGNAPGDGTPTSRTPVAVIW